MERPQQAEMPDFMTMVKDGPGVEVDDPREKGGGHAVPLTRRLDRYLKSVPVIAFGITLASSWEGVGGGFQAGLLNGGPACLVWGYLLAGPGTAMIVLSLAEMASVTPSVGAQYRFAAIYCPEYLPRRFFAFLQGWITVFAWIAGTTILPFFTGSQILGLVILNYPGYVYQGWHATLVGYAITLVPVIFNIFARRTLKAIEVVGVLLHLMFFVAFIVVIISLGGRNSAEYVFFGTSGGVSGWKNPVMQWLIGLTTPVFTLIGFDGVLHMSDEVQQPEIRIPRTMVTSWTVSTVTAFIFMIILLFFMGDPEAALNTNTNWPIIEICHQAARSLPGTNMLMCMIIVPGIISYFNGLVSLSRLVWAFARDDGLPFSNFFKVVHPTLRMPLRALALTVVIIMLLLLIPIGSATAFNAVLSLGLLSLFMSFTIPIIFILMRRIGGEEIAKGPWSLGRWAIWINGGAVVWGVFICIWLCFPPELPVTAANMNWAGPIVGFVILFALVDWSFRGRFKFAVPTEKRERPEDYLRRTEQLEQEKY